MKSWALRLTKLMFGLMLCGFSIIMAIEADLGLAPMDLLNMGIFYHTGISLGVINIIVSFIFLAFDYFHLNTKIGIGTILNTVFVGVFMDMFIAMDIFTTPDTFIMKTVMFVVSMIITAISLYFYIDAGLGAGPRDALFIGLAIKYKFSANVSRGLTDALVVLVGFLLGAPVGFGTVLFVFGFSVIMKYVFLILRFDVKSVNHEGIEETFKLKSFKKQPPSDADIDNTNINIDTDIES